MKGLHTPPRIVRNSSFSIIIAFVTLAFVGLALIPFIESSDQGQESTNRLSISFSLQKASPELIEETITSRVEGMLSIVKGLSQISSTSSFGWGMVTVIVDKSNDLNEVKNEVLALMRQIYPTFPAGASFPLVQLSQKSQKAGKLAIVAYNLWFDKNSEKLNNRIENNITNILKRRAGVSDVKIINNNELCYKVNYDPLEMRKFGLTSDIIVKQIYSHFSRREVGRVKTGNVRLGLPEEISYLSYELSRKDISGLDQVFLINYKGRNIYLTDVAEINIDKIRSDITHRIDGQQVHQLVVTATESHQNFLTVRDIRKTVDSLKKVLPNNVHITEVYDSTEEFIREVGEVCLRAFAAIIVILTAIFIFSRSVKYTLIMIICIAVNLAIAFVFYYFLRLEMTLVTVSASVVSVGFIVGSFIVAANYHLEKENIKSNRGLVVVTLTTITSLSIIFFLDEETRSLLIPFAIPLGVNLFVSLFVSIFLIPALLHKLAVATVSDNGKLTCWKRRMFRFQMIFFALILRRKKIIIFLFVILFGFPVYLLPEKLENDAKLSSYYNLTFGSYFYQKKVKKWVNLFLGGTSRFLHEHIDTPVPEHKGTQSENILSLNIKLPNETNSQQIDKIAQDFEIYISKFKGVKQYETKIKSYKSASLQIKFTDEGDNMNFPFFLKSQLEGKARNNGFAEFYIYGIGRGFNNEIPLDIDNQALVLKGYSYPKLVSLANFVRNILNKHERVQHVSIVSQRDLTGTTPSYEYVFNMDKPEKSFASNFNIPEISNTLSVMSSRPQFSGSTLFDNEQYMPVVLNPIIENMGIEELMNEPLLLGNSSFNKFKEFVSVLKEKVGENIIRNNQEYQIFVTYNFIGNKFLSDKLIYDVAKESRKVFPYGYSIDIAEPVKQWYENSSNQWVVLITILIVFIATSIAFDSFFQPLIVIFLIPVCFIGVFIVARFFQFPFDEGGLLSLIVLCGLVIYFTINIVNYFNQLLDIYPRTSILNIYIKALNAKYIPALFAAFTILLGVLPFFMFPVQKSILYTFSICTGGGVIFLLICIPLILPCLVIKKDIVEHGNKK